ncbi:unnamed protein product, partial [Brachionus calyciflorus]
MRLKSVFLAVFLIYLNLTQFTLCEIDSETTETTTIKTTATTESSTSTQSTATSESSTTISKITEVLTTSNEPIT